VISLTPTPTPTLLVLELAINASLAYTELQHPNTLAELTAHRTAKAYIAMLAAFSDEENQ
jgi:hypothetical protein